MTFIDIDGMDDWSGQPDATLGKYTVFSTTGGAITWGSAFGRFGGGGVKLTCGLGSGANSFAMLTRNYGVAAQVTMGFGCNVTYPSHVLLGPSSLVEFCDGPNGQIALCMDANSIQLRNNRCTNNIGGGGSNNSGTLLSQITNTVPNNTWHWFEIQITFHASAGSVLVKMDGTTTLFNLSGINTAPSGFNRANLFNFVCSNVSFNNPLDVLENIFDDWYLSTDPTATLLGDRRIDTVYPTSDDTVQWTPNSGANNFSRVSEHAEDGDTTFVTAGSGGLKDIYNKGATPAGVSAIDLVKVNVIARKDDANPRTITLGMKNGGTEVDAGSAHNLGSSYEYFFDLFPNDPATSAPWASKAAVDSAKIVLISG